MGWQDGVKWKTEELHDWFSKKEWFPTILHLGNTYIFIDVSQKVYTIENKIKDQVACSKQWNHFKYHDNQIEFGRTTPRIGVNQEKN